MPAGNHEGELSTFFYTVASLGAATMRTSLLMHWTGWEKQVPGFWAELQSRYRNHLSPGEVEDGWRLWIWQNEEHITLIAMDPANAEEKTRWWGDVQELASAPPPGRKRKVAAQE